MKKTMILAVLLISIYSQAQQVWTRDKGKFYSQIGGTLYFYDSKINIDNSITAIDRKVTSNAIQGYLEYGVTDKLTANIIVPFVLSDSKNTAKTQPIGISDGSLNAFGNINLGLTYNFYKKNGYVLSTKLQSTLPTASFKENTGLRTGTDSFGIAPSFLAGYGGNSFFASAELGLNYRTNKYSSQTIGGFQIGKSFGANKKLLIIFHNEIQSSNYDGKYDDKNSIYTITYLNNQTYFAHGFKFGYKLNTNIMAWADIRTGSYTANLGANSSPTPGLSFAVSYSN
jgi:hypothetical protein